MDDAEQNAAAGGLAAGLLAHRAAQQCFTFNSTLVQEVVYSKLPEKQRRELHAKAADEIRSQMRAHEHERGGAWGGAWGGGTNGTAAPCPPARRFASSLH